MVARIYRSLYLVTTNMSLTHFPKVTRSYHLEIILMHNFLHLFYRQTNNKATLENSSKFLGTIHLCKYGYDLSNFSIEGQSGKVHTS